MQFRKKPVIIEAAQWFKNGDHPQDHDPIGIKNPTSQDIERYADYKGFEGKVVRYFRRPDVSGQKPCDKCGQPMHDHGWIDTFEGGHIVCPGDWIITGVQGERYPCKPDIFAKTYELAEASPASVPEGWKHSCNALCLDGVELWVPQCPHCGKPAPTPPASEDRKDAERYRWLRSSSTGPSQIWELLSDDCQPPILTLKSMGDLDAAIDKAMQEDKP